MRSNFQGYTIPIDQEGTLPDYRNLSMQELNAQSYKITRRQDNNNPQAPDVSLQKKKGLSEERLRAGRHNENSKRTSTPSLTSSHIYSLSEESASSFTKSLPRCVVSHHLPLSRSQTCFVISKFSSHPSHTHIGS